MKLTLGPTLFNWPPAKWQDFYFRIADEAPVDAVAIGEVVCSKRIPLLADRVPAVVDRLARAGKEVLLSSLALVTQARERKSTIDLAESEHMIVEANDMSCLARLAGRPHVIGPFINIYNEATAQFFSRRGAARICLPPELPMPSIAAIAKAVPDVVVEVLAFGRIPLAISARCYHARLYGLSKDNCQFVCVNDADGVVVDTLDGEGILAINGVQTLSHSAIDLIADLDELTSIGVGACRLSPLSCDMVAVAALFRAVLDGRLDGEEARGRLISIYPQVPHSNGFLHGRAGADWIDPLSPPRSAAGAADRGGARPSAR